MDLKHKKKIAVIGAGPAGLTAALELKDRGWEEVTVFGHFEEAQFRTLEVGGIRFDVAACLLHFGYQSTVVPLAERFGIEVNYLTKSPDIVNERLEIQPKSRFGILFTYLLFPYYLLFFLLWLLLHRTKLRSLFSLSYYDFLKKVGLGAWSHSYSTGPGGSAQGYGFLDEVTAYHAFRWFRPGLFLTPFASPFKKGVATLSEGYECLFKRIHDELQVKAQKVKLVQPSIGEVQIHLENGDQLRFDEVIIACPLDQIQFPFSYLLEGNILEETHLFSYLFSSKRRPSFDDRGYFMDLIEEKAKNKALVMRTGGVMDNGDHLMWAVGYKEKSTSKAELQKLLETQIQEDCNLQIQEVHFFDFFRYNIRFSSKAVQKGIPHQLDLRQGYKHIWYSGGLMSHWDISSIYQFNKSLINKMELHAQGKSIYQYLIYFWRQLKNMFRLF